MKELTQKEIHDCSNCRFSKQVSPYKVLLECEIDMKVKLQPHICGKWDSVLNSLFNSEEGRRREDERDIGNYYGGNA